MALLSVRFLTKRFGGLIALNNFSLDVEEGEIVGMIGPNGSGKTTFFNVLSGVYKADSGEVFFDDHSENLLELKTHQIIGLGIARTFQNQRPFNNLSVLENLMIGGHCRTRAGLFSALFSLPWARKEREQLKAHAREVMADAPGIWLLAGAGLIAVYGHPRAWSHRRFLGAFLLGSLLAIVPGFYFRPHYSTTWGGARSTTLRQERN